MIQHLQIIGLLTGMPNYHAKQFENRIHVPYPTCQLLNSSPKKCFTKFEIFFIKN